MMVRQRLDPHLQVHANLLPITLVHMLVACTWPTYASSFEEQDDPLHFMTDTVEMFESSPSSMVVGSSSLLQIRKKSQPTSHETELDQRAIPLHHRTNVSEPHMVSLISGQSQATLVDPANSGQMSSRVRVILQIPQNIIANTDSDFNTRKKAAFESSNVSVKLQDAPAPQQLVPLSENLRFAVDAVHCWWFRFWISVLIFLLFLSIQQRSKSRSGISWLRFYLGHDPAPEALQAPRMPNAHTSFGIPLALVNDSCCAESAVFHIGVRPVVYSLRASLSRMSKLHPWSKIELSLELGPHFGARPQILTSSLGGPDRSTVEIHGNNGLVGTIKHQEGSLYTLEQEDGQVYAIEAHPHFHCITIMKDGKDVAVTSCHRHSKSMPQFVQVDVEPRIHSTHASVLFMSIFSLFVFEF